jgi:hypothetical protein
MGEGEHSILAFNTLGLGLHTTDLTAESGGASLGKYDLDGRRSRLQTRSQPPGMNLGSAFGEGGVDVMGAE